MKSVVKEAIEVLQDLPEERQELVARVILNYAEQEDDVYHLSDDERRLIDEGLASPLVREEQMQSFWRRHAV